MVKPGDFFEDDEQEPVRDEGPCEFSTGVVTLRSGAPVVELCGQPGTTRRGIMWCEVYACDGCYTRWLDRINGRKSE